MKKNFVIALVVLAACLFAACGELVEKPSSLYSLVEVLPGPPGYEGNGAVHGLLNGTYLVKHQKKQTRQDKDPEGRIRIWHEEDWYAVDADGAVRKIASSTGGIPRPAGSVPLEKGEYGFRGGSPYDRIHPHWYTLYAVNSITGLVNGETYGVYRYGELKDGDNIGRFNGQLQTEDANAFANIINLRPGETISLFDTVLDNGTSGLLNDNNHLVVLTGTGLYWTKTPQSVVTNTRIKGYDFDILIESRESASGAMDVTPIEVSPIEFDGQPYFILTSSGAFAGNIRIVNKQ